MSRREISSPGASSAAESPSASTEQRGPVLRAEEQWLRARFEQRAQRYERQPVGFGEHRRVGRHHRAARRIGQALGHPRRIAAAGGDAVEAGAPRRGGGGPRPPPEPPPRGGPPGPPAPPPA